jgi:AcrR family transcriptional regulator
MNRQLRWGGGSRLDDPSEARSIILRAALDCMTTMGIEKFTIDDVARAAHISRRSLYRYYSDKRSLIEAAINAENEAFFNALRESLSAHEADIRRYVEECICFAARYRAQHSRIKQNYFAKDASMELLPYVLGNIAPMWRAVLERPYAHYAAGPDGARLSFDALVALSSRLGLAYSLLPVDEAAIRADMQALNALFGGGA